MMMSLQSSPPVDRSRCPPAPGKGRAMVKCPAPTAASPQGTLRRSFRGHQVNPRRGSMFNAGNYFWRPELHDCCRSVFSPLRIPTAAWGCHPRGGPHFFSKRMMWMTRAKWFRCARRSNAEVVKPASAPDHVAFRNDSYLATGGWPRANLHDCRRG